MRVKQRKFAFFFLILSKGEFIYYEFPIQLFKGTMIWNNHETSHPMLKV